MPPFELVSLPAIDDEGRPLWPERYDLQELARIRAMVGEYNWWSQYMQRPRPKGGRVFGESARVMPPVQILGRKIVLSADTAGSEDTKADHTAIAVQAFYRAIWTSPEGIALTGMLHGDLLRVYRFKLDTPDVVRVLDVLQKDWQGAPFVIETQGGAGKSVAQVFRRLRPHLRIVEVPRTTDKFTASQPCAAANNQGRWKVPVRHDPSLDSVALQKLMRELKVWDEGEWISPCLRELERFTGSGKDPEDDQVDAIVHGWDFADKLPATKPKAPPKTSARKATRTGGY